MPDEDDLVRFDETLLEADEATPELPGDGALRAELVRQRVAHGLLRTAHEADRASARERRVQAIIAALPAATSGRVIRMRPWLSLAAAVLVAAAIWYMVSPPGESPRLEAMIDDAVLRLQERVDRRYRLRVEQLEQDGEYRLCGTHELTVRPGYVHLRVDGSRVGKWELGCDGNELWRRKLDGNGQVETRPVSEQRQMFADFTNGGLMDLGYLDVARVLQAVPPGVDFDREQTEPTESDRAELVAIRVEDAFEFLGGALDNLVVHIDPKTDEVYRLAFRLADSYLEEDTVFKFEFRFEGVLSADMNPEKLYVRPR